MAATVIPLTTTFTPPPDCLASLTYSGGYLLLGQDSSCWPSGAATYSNDPVFSPGWICPSGWTSAYGTTVTAATLTETKVACCPSLGHIRFTGESRMYFSNSYGFGCTAWIWGPITASVLSGSTSYPTTITSYVSPSYTTVRAQVVQIAWQASDLYSSPKSTSTSTTTQSTSSTTMSAASSPTPTESDSPSGLSTAAKISIGVVIPVVVLAALALSFFIIRRRKTKAKSPTREIQQEIIQDGHSSLVESKTNSRYGTP